MEFKNFIDNIEKDVIELRERKWVTRNAVAAPATIAQVHEAVRCF
jgi:hypothetical protein